MEGEPDSWTTVEKKLPKKKGGRDVSKDQAGGDKGQGGDRRKKDSVGSRSDRGDRRPQDNRRSDRGGGYQGDRGGGHQGDRGGGRRPPSGRGGSAQRNTLPRKPRDGDSGHGGKDSGLSSQGARVPHRSGGAQGPGAGNNAEKKATTVVANPWEALAASSSNSSSSNSPRKQSWASLVDRGASEPREKSPSPLSKPTTTAAPAPTAWANKIAQSEAPVSAPAPSAWASTHATSTAPVNTPSLASTVDSDDKPAPTTTVSPSETVSAAAPSISPAAPVNVTSAAASVPAVTAPSVPAVTAPSAAPVKTTTPPNTAPAPKPVSPWALDAPVFVPRSIPPPVANLGGLKENAVTFKKPAIISASAPEFVPKSALVKEAIGVKDTLQKPLPDLALVSNESKLQNTIVPQNLEQKELKPIDQISTVEPVKIDDEKTAALSTSTEDTKSNLQNMAAEIDKDAIDISNVNVAKKVDNVIPENLECDTKQVANHELSKKEIVVQEETDSSANVSTNPTQQTTNDITSNETKSKGEVEVSNSSFEPTLDVKSGEGLDNDQDGSNIKVETPAKDDSLDANGNNVSLDSNKNKVSKGMTPDMEDVLSKIDPDSRHYDRDILLLLQKHPLSLQKPDKLPELEIVLDVPLRSSSSAPLLGDRPQGVSIANSFARPGGMPTRRDSRRKEPKKVISISREPVKLRTSDNAYKPGKENKPKDNALEVLGKKVRAILNKLTPQKFQTLVVQFKEIEINTEERLALAIELIFEKAVEEPAYSTAYASLCKELSLKRVTKEGSDEVVDFRSLLLEQCRNEFQRDYISESDRKKYAEDMKNAENEEEKRKVKAEFELLESKMRKRSLGNMRFIGELYLQQLTRQQIIHQNIISRLLSTIEEESLECLCRFLTTCGAKLQADQVNIPENMREQFSFDRYFARIKTIIDEKKTSSRVRFMLQDLIELRANKWVNKRRKEAGPKTIDDIHKEAKIEALKVQLNDSQHSAPVARRSEEKNRRKTEFRPKMAQNNDDGGWNNVPTRAAKVSLDMDPEKLRSIRKVDADSLRLGGQFSSWGMGSSSAASKANSGVSRRPTNRFELLEDIEQPAHTEISHLYAGRASEPVIRSHDRSSSRASASLDEHREDSRNNSAERSSNVLRGSADIDTEALRSKYKLLLREYLSNCDFQETVNSVFELFSQSTIEILVEETVNQGLEENVLKNRSACGRLLYGLVKEGALNQETICQGLSLTLEMADDLIIDIPKFWEFLADILVIVVVELSCFDTLVQGCANHLPDGTSRKKFISSLLLAIKKTHQDKLSDYISKHKGLLEELLSQNLAEVLQECNISVDEAAVVSGTVKGPSEEKLVNGNLQESLHRQLTNLMEKSDTGNKEIEAVGKIMRDKPLDNETIRTLVYAVMESVVTNEGSGACSVNKDLLTERIPILKKYIDATKERELYAMFALQNLVNKLHHPNKLLHNMIEQLYDGEVISDDGIFDWEKNLDVDEQEGKGVAVAGCKQFLEWLRTADEASEEESP